MCITAVHQITARDVNQECVDEIHYDCGDPILNLLKPLYVYLGTGTIRIDFKGTHETHKLTLPSEANELLNRLRDYKFTNSISELAARIHCNNESIEAYRDDREYPRLRFES